MCFFIDPTFFVTPTVSQKRTKLTLHLVPPRVEYFELDYMIMLTTADLNHNRFMISF